MERDSIYAEPSDSYNMANEQANKDTEDRFGPEWMYDPEAREYQSERFFYHCETNERAKG